MHIQTLTSILILFLSRSRSLHPLSSTIHNYKALHFSFHCQINYTISLVMHVRLCFSSAFVAAGCSWCLLFVVYRIHFVDTHIFSMSFCYYYYRLRYCCEWTKIFCSAIWMNISLPVVYPSLFDIAHRTPAMLISHSTHTYKCRTSARSRARWIIVDRSMPIHRFTSMDFSILKMTLRNAKEPFFYFTF